MIRSGQLRHRCQLYQSMTERNEFGEAVSTLGFLKNFQAEVVTSRVDSQMQADGQSYLSDLTLRARFNRAYQPDAIVGFDGKYYRITRSDNPGGRREESILSLEEVRGFSIN